MDIENIFDKKVKRLGKLITSDDPDDTLEISNILWQLLCDEQSSKFAKLKKSKFKINDHMPKHMKLEGTIIIFEFMGRELSPDKSDWPEESQSTKYVDLERFLNTQVGTVVNIPVNIKEIIHYCRNIIGGVHIDSSTTKKRDYPVEKLKLIEEAVVKQGSGISLILDTLKIIGYIVYQGLAEEYARTTRS